MRCSITCKYSLIIAALNKFNRSTNQRLFISIFILSFVRSFGHLSSERKFAICSASCGYHEIFTKWYFNSEQIPIFIGRINSKFFFSFGTFFVCGNLLGVILYVHFFFAISNILNVRNSKPHAVWFSMNAEITLASVIWCYWLRIAHKTGQKTTKFKMEI